MISISLYCLLFTLVTSTTYYETINYDDPYKLIKVSIATFIVSDDITVKLNLVNGTNSYYIATASFTDNFNQEYLDPQYFYGQTNNNVDLAGARYQDEQILNLQKTDIAQIQLYIYVYNVNPFYRSETFELSIQVIDEKECKECEKGTSSGCMCKKGSCKSNYFGDYCERKFTTIDVEEFDKQDNKTVSLKGNTITHYLLKEAKGWFVAFHLKKGKVQLYHHSKSFPNYFNVESVFGQKRFYRLQSIRPQYIITKFLNTATLKEGQQNEQEDTYTEIYLTLATYEENAQVQMQFYRQPLSAAVIFWIVVGGIAGLVVLIFLIAAIVNVCSNCDFSSNNNHHHGGPVVNMAQQKKKKYNIELLPKVQLAKVMELLQSKGSLSEQEVQPQYYEKYEQFPIQSVCVICMSQILRQDIVRVGYCGHIYHSNCLDGWFSKNQSCPYCRQSHTAQSMQGHYGIILNEFPEAKRGNQYLLAAILKNTKAR